MGASRQRADGRLVVFLLSTFLFCNEHSLRKLASAFQEADPSATAFWKALLYSNLPSFAC
jgi:hypothetical protein